MSAIISVCWVENTDTQGSPAAKVGMSYIFEHKFHFCMMVDIGQTKTSSRENPKFAAPILDFLPPSRILTFMNKNLL